MTIQQSEIDQLLADFKRYICGRDDIDPDDELNWRDLSIGWALGRGARIETARDFARQLRYDHHYFSEDWHSR